MIGMFDYQVIISISFIINVLLIFCIIWINEVHREEIKFLKEMCSNIYNKDENKNKNKKEKR